MTACVKNHSKRVALAISASLVGALTLGAAAPAVAFAEGIAAQSVTATDGLEGGKLTGAVDIENKKITIPATGEITFVADGKPQGVIPSEVTIGQGVAVEKISLNDFQYTLKFYEANEDFSKGVPTYNGVAIQGSAPFAVGKYVVEMTLTSGEYAGSTISVPFEIKAAELDGLTAVDSVDGSFEYDGTDQLPNIDYKIGDKLVDADLFNAMVISAAMPVAATTVVFAEMFTDDSSAAGDPLPRTVGTDPHTESACGARHQRASRQTVRKGIHSHVQNHQSRHRRTRPRRNRHALLGTRRVPRPFRHRRRMRPRKGAA